MAGQQEGVPCDHLPVLNSLQPSNDAVTVSTSRGRSRDGVRSHTRGRSGTTWTETRKHPIISMLPVKLPDGVWPNTGCKASAVVISLPCFPHTQNMFFIVSVRRLPWFDLILRVLHSSLFHRRYRPTSLSPTSPLASEPDIIRLWDQSASFERTFVR